MTEIKFASSWEPNKSRYNRRISDEEWNTHKPKLTRLHEQKKTRAQILEIIAEDFEDVKPTYGQLCTKFEKWGYIVYKKAGTGNNATDSAPTGPRNEDAQTLHPGDSNQYGSPGSSNGSTVVPGFRDLRVEDQTTPRIRDESSPPVIYSSPLANNGMFGSWRSPPSRSANSVTTQLHAGSNSRMTEDRQSWTSNLSVGSGQPQSSLLENAVNAVQSRPQDAARQLQRRILRDSVAVTPEDMAASHTRQQKANEALDAVAQYLQSVASRQQAGQHILFMINTAAYLFATRAYSSAFKIYRKVYDLMTADVQCDDVTRIGAVMRCAQSAVMPQDLEVMQRELDTVLRYEFEDDMLNTVVTRLLLDVENRMMEGTPTKNLLEPRSSIMQDLRKVAIDGTGSTYSGSKELYWRLKLIDHTPSYSGCPRMLKLLSELLTWAWAAMLVEGNFPEAASQKGSCLCDDGMYFDFVRMTTTHLLRAARTMPLLLLEGVRDYSRVTCMCVMCADLITMFEICPIETLTAIAYLTVERCRLENTNCNPQGPHQELSPKVIFQQQFRPTADQLLTQVMGNIGPNRTKDIDVLDLYDDYLYRLWFMFETQEALPRKAKFDPDPTKIDDLLTSVVDKYVTRTPTMTTAGLARTISNPHAGPDLSFQSQPRSAAEENIADITLTNAISNTKRTRSDASSLHASLSSASRNSERSMIRMKKRLKHRSSVADILSSYPSSSSLQSRNSYRFSYVTGLPEDSMWEGGGSLPPDITPVSEAPIIEEEAQDLFGSESQPVHQPTQSQPQQYMQQQPQRQAHPQPQYTTTWIEDPTESPQLRAWRNSNLQARKLNLRSGTGSTRGHTMGSASIDNTADNGAGGDSSIRSVDSSQFGTSHSHPNPHQQPQSQPQRHETLNWNNADIYASAHESFALDAQQAEQAARQAQHQSAQVHAGQQAALPEHMRGYTNTNTTGQNRGGSRIVSIGGR